MLMNKLILVINVMNNVYNAMVEMNITVFFVIMDYFYMIMNVKMNVQVIIMN